MNRLLPSAAAALLALALPLGAFAQASAVPNLMSYQSRVADAAGVPLGSTAPVNRIVLFRVWDSPGASAPANRLFSEQQTVTIANGEFSVLIGSGTAIATENTNAFATLDAAVFGGAIRYLGVTVDDGDGNPNNDPELSPRQQIVGTPFAFRAKVAEAVASGGVNALSLSNGSVGTAALAAGSVTGAKLAPGAVGPGQIADAAVGTGQIVDASITTAKIAPDSIDGSKIVNGSIGLADLSPAVTGTLPKPSTVYNQGLGAAPTNAQWLVFPIDANDLGVDGEVVISYEGALKTNTNSNPDPLGSQNSGSIALSSFFAGRTRITLPNFVGGTVNYQWGNLGSFSVLNNSGAAAAAPTTTNIPFVAVHQGMGYKSNFAMTGLLNTNSLSGNSIYAGAEPGDPGMPNNGSYFPVGLLTWTSATNNATGVVYNPTPTGFVQNTPTPVAASVFYSQATTTQAQVGAFQTDPYTLQYNNFNQTFSYTVRSGKVFPFLYVFSYFPGTLGGFSTPFTQNIPNSSTNVNAAGPAQALAIASIQTGVNKLTIFTTNSHIIQVGNTVVLSGVTGAPAVNASYPVTAVPTADSFEISVPGAAGPYTGGTITHTPSFNRYRFWVAVHTLYNARVTVSDK